MENIQKEKKERKKKEKKKKTEDLIQDLADAKAAAEYKEVFLGLDELLSRTITINRNNLVEAFQIARKGVRNTLETIAIHNKFDFKPVHSTLEVDESLGDEIFDVIDPVIENVVQAKEAELFGIGSEPTTGVAIDDYEAVPNFGVLAFNDGYITRGELEQAQGAFEEAESEYSTGQTIDKILISKDFLQRKDLSRLFAKQALIETRLLDREFSQMLIDRGVVSAKDADRAFRKQLNNFEDSGVSVMVGDILVESDVIAPELRDEVIAEQDRSGGPEKKASPSAFSSEFGAFVDLQVSEDRVQAWIRVPKTCQGTTDVSPVKALIKKRGIAFGVVKDTQIRDFIENCTDPHEKFVVAQGIPASVGTPANIVYHFNTEHEGAGVVREDGSIDFTARGDSPYVKKGDLLAEKRPMEHPRTGTDIFGETLLVGDVEDVPLKGGDGVTVSDDELKIHAALSGQPSLNGAGAVSVLEQFTVRGDVDFKTGNINFNGNVLVTGTIKEGFTVECDDLTANEINGAKIMIRGDLKVSNGIAKAYVESHGNVQAKFLNNVKVFGGKNMMVTREIMGSKVLVSGALNNETGRITDSTIAARLGMSVKQIGTEKSEISTVKVGADDHIKWISGLFDQKIAKHIQSREAQIKGKSEMESTHNSLHVDVANQTFAQEKLNKKMEFIENKMEAVGQEERNNLSKELKEIEDSIAQADTRIKEIFTRQDKVAQEVDACDTLIQNANTEIEALKNEKAVVLEGLSKQDSVPVLSINKKVFRGTRIMGTEASLVLQKELGPSKFTETEPETPDVPKQFSHQVINF